MDYGHKQTDVMLKNLEKRIQKVYAQAARETEEKLNKHLSAYKVKYNKKLADLKSGKITHAEFLRWNQGQIMTGKRWQEMRDSLATDLVNKDNIALSIINGHTPEVYALNHNYGTFEVEKGSMLDTSYTLYDRQTVERLLRDDPQLIPTPKLDRNKDLRWNKSRFNTGIMQGILQGESIQKMAKRVALGMSNSDMKAAIRNARTATTGAENAGRLDSYARAEQMGISVNKIWLAVMDGRTRDSHRELDGEEVAYNEEFSNGLMYPGDPGGAPGDVWNCRCTMVADVGQGKGDFWDNRHNDALGDMTYEEWKHEHGIDEDMIDESGIADILHPDNSTPSRTRKALVDAGVSFLKVTTHKTKQTTQQIINRLGGGDRTTGSCASLSMAYAGNKAGYSVLDFRGGKSQATFSRSVYLNEIASLPGVDGVVERGFNDFTTAHSLLGKVQDGKEYALGVGRHMAIVRKSGDGYEYLELQSAYSNGFKALDDNVLKRRFGCQKSHTTYGHKYQVSGELIEVESLGKNREFQNLLGYINTEEGKQMKGVLGSVK